MGRTACTEPQYLYKGALYLYLNLQSPYYFSITLCNTFIFLLCTPIGIDKGHNVWWLIHFPLTSCTFRSHWVILRETSFGNVVIQNAVSLQYLSAVSDVVSLKMSSKFATRRN